MTEVNRSADPRLSRLRALAGSSIVGADLKWLLEHYDRQKALLERLTTICVHVSNVPTSELGDGVNWTEFETATDEAEAYLSE